MYPVDAIKVCNIGFLFFVSEFEIFLLRCYISKLKKTPYCRFLIV